MIACAYWMVFLHTAWGSYATRSRAWVTTTVCNTGKFICAVIICSAFRSSTACRASGITRNSIRADTHGITLWWSCTDGIGPTWVSQTRTGRFWDTTWVWITFVAWFTIARFLIPSDVTVSITATRPRLTQRYHRYCKRQNNQIYAPYKSTVPLEMNSRKKIWY